MMGTWFQFLDQETFYLSLDSELLVDVISTDLSYLKVREGGREGGGRRERGEKGEIHHVVRPFLCISEVLAVLSIPFFPPSYFSPPLSHPSFSPPLSLSLPPQSNWKLMGCPLLTLPILWTMLGDADSWDSSPVFRLLHKIKSGYMNGVRWACRCGR